MWLVLHKLMYYLRSNEAAQIFGSNIDILQLYQEISSQYYTNMQMNPRPFKMAFW